jgi:hypothetical protein
MAPGTALADDAGMKKRAFASVLWFVTGYFVGAAAAYVLGATMLIAPVVGVAAAAVIAVDPRHAIWTTSPAGSAANTDRLEVTVLRA